MSPRLIAAMAILGFAALPVWADMSNLLSPIGSPQFTESITQSGWAPVTSSSQYVGLRVVAAGKTGAFIEHVAGLANEVSGTQRYNSSDRLIESWWENASPAGFSATYELNSVLGQSAAQDPASYVGLRVETALAGLDGQITASRQWVFTNGLSPSLLGPGSKWLPTSADGWYMTELANDGHNWGGGQVLAGPASAAPAPGAAVLALIGLGLIGWLKRQTA